MLIAIGTSIVARFRMYPKTIKQKVSDIDILALNINIPKVELMHGHTRHQIGQRLFVAEFHARLWSLPSNRRVCLERYLPLHIVVPSTLPEFQVLKKERRVSQGEGTVNTNERYVWILFQDHFRVAALQLIY